MTSAIIEKISKFESKIIIDKLSCSMANSLRRIMISEIPTLSIDLVSIEINTSLINDEFLSHRLGLIPLKSVCIKKMKYTRECECDNYCKNCSSVFNLNIKSICPETTIYSTHIENIDHKADFLGFPVEPVHDSGSNSRFSNKSIIIAKLKIGQHIKLICVAKKGTGSQHSKWSPVSVIKLKTEPIFYINLDNLNNILNCHQKASLSNLAKKEIGFDENKRSLIFTKKNKEILNSFSETDIKFLFKYLDEQNILSKKILTLETNYSKITFELETTGVLEPCEIFKESILILKRKLNILGVHLEKNF